MRHTISGLPVRPVSPAVLHQLDDIGSPFIRYEVPVTPRGVSETLWVLSHDYSPNSRLRRWWFMRQIRKVKYLATVKELAAYIPRAPHLHEPAAPGGLVLTRKGQT